MMVNANIRKLSPFNPDVLAQSFFERLINEGRVMHAFLDTQYRMHPAISRITSVPFYQCYFRCPLPLSMFLTQYNQPDVNKNGFHPMTFIDTSGITGKEESSAEPGHYVNEVEATIVANIINTLHSLVPVEELDSEIAVIAPYRSQVERISYVISRQVRACNTHVQRNRRNIHVSTVDAMQGSERSVIIFSTTRSNTEGVVGFVSDMRRLNVSVSRARMLNIVIGDFSTIKTGPEGSRRGIDGLQQIYRGCSQGAQPGARLALARNNTVPVNNSEAEGDFVFEYQPIDAMQGSERSVIIFSTTRSNTEGVVGFVSDMRRLNVSVSRARMLNIVIGDFGTIRTGPEGSKRGIDGLQQIYRGCSRGAQPGARLALARNNTGPNNSEAEGDFVFEYQPPSEPAQTRSVTQAGGGQATQILEVSPDKDFAELFRR